MPPMSDRWIIFQNAMSEASHTVLIIWLIANATLAARWSIQYIPLKFRSLALNLFDAWLVAINLYLFITA